MRASQSICFARLFQKRRFFTRREDDRAIIAPLDTANPVSRISATLQFQEITVTRLLTIAVTAILFVTAIAAPAAEAPKPVTVTLEGVSNHMALSPDGKLLAFETASGVTVADTTTGQPVTKLKPEAWGLTFTPDGKSLITGGSNAADNVFRVWDTSTWTARLELKGHKAGADYMQVTPDSSRLLVYDQNGGLAVWDLNAGTPVAQIDLSTKKGTSAALSSNGKTLYAMSGNDTLKKFDVVTDKEVKSIPIAPKTFYTEIAADTSRMIAITNELAIWDLVTGKPVPLKKDPRDYSTVWGSGILMPDGKTAAMTYGAMINQERLVLWDIISGAIKAQSAEIIPASICLTSSPSGNRLFACLRDGSVRAWDTATLKPIVTIPGFFAKLPDNLTTNRMRIVSSADGSVFATHDSALGGAAAASLKVWHLAGKP
jgi:WD40 repeat protein